MTGYKIISKIQDSIYWGFEVLVNKNGIIESVFIKNKEILNHRHVGKLFSELEMEYSFHPAKLNKVTITKTSPTS